MRRAPGTPAGDRPTLMSPTGATASSAGFSVGAGATPSTKSGVSRATSAAPSRPRDPHIDAKVAARNAALNVAGGVKVDVFVRVRPRVSEDGEAAEILGVADNEIALKDRDGRGADVFKFDKVFGQEVSNDLLFDSGVRGIVDQVARGLSTCIMCYGQTGSGKTYTMRGDLSDDPSRYGIIQRSVGWLMDSMKKSHTDIRMRVSFLEVYNENLEDLFIPVAGSTTPSDGLMSPSFARGASARPASTAASLSNPDANAISFEQAKETIEALPKAPAGGSTTTSFGSSLLGSSSAAVGMKPLTLVDHPDRGTVCLGLSEVEVSSVEQVVWLLQRAEERSRFTATAMNKQSNRAHRIFTFLLQFRRGDVWLTSTLTLVDLAGSEDIGRSGATGAAAKEASHINKSLLTLGRVINALASNSPHIPYRESKLTRLLSEALGGVCKTTFIACVSPAASSATETASTLRYAKRASEALNISQLPRWQQDEILIEGLTRRVQMLESELASKDGHHAREMASMQAKVDALRRDNAALADHLSRAQTHVQRLCEQQLAARTALHAVTAHRDRLEAQKAALKAELLETRRARDGYLTDRTALMNNLTGVRATREALLAAYHEVEGKLTIDCTTLKGTIERALTEMDSLHTEISRKRQLSSFNEHAADVFGDEMVGRLRSVIEAVFQFRDGQSERHGVAMQTLSDLALEREQHSNSVQSEVRALVHATVNVFTGLAETVAAAEVAAKARSLRQREETRSQVDSSSQLIAQLREAVETGLATTRTQAAQLEDALKKWASKTSQRFDGLQSAVEGFVGRLVTDLTGLQSFAAESAAAQVSRLAEHEKTIEAYRESEQTALAAAAQRMISELTSHVNRIVNEASSEASRRVERAAASLRDETQSISGDIREAAKTHTAQITMLTNAATAHREHIGNEITDGKKQSANAHENAASMVTSLSAATKITEADVGDRSTKLTTRWGVFAREFAERSLEGDAAVEQVTANVKESVTAGTLASKSAGDSTCQTLQDAAAQHSNDITEAQTNAEERWAHAQAYVDNVVEDAKEQEATVNVYVHTTIKRDTQPDPKPTRYTYPTQYAAMPPYPTVVSASDNAEMVDSWTREENVRAGRALPGQGVDFTGEKGAPDYSGILTSPRATDNVEAIIARLRDRSSTAPKPDLASLDTAALSSVARAVVEDVENAAKGMDVDLEMWFASLSALIEEHGGSLSTDTSADDAGRAARAASPLRLLRAQSAKRLGAVPSALLHSPMGASAAIALANPQSPLSSPERSPRNSVSTASVPQDPAPAAAAEGDAAVPEVI